MGKPDLGERHGVLITRPLADARETAQLVEARGWVPVVAPVLQVRQGAVAPGLPIDAVLVTSRNAVPALPADYHPLLLLAVGRATAARSRQAGFGTVIDADGDARDLAALTCRTLPAGSRLLVAHGRGQGGALMAALRRSGFVVLGRCAYAVSPVRRLPPAAETALRAEELRAATFLSAETARAFVRLVPQRLLPLLADVDAVAIGPGVADALSPLPWRRVHVSVRPTLDQVLALL